MHAPLLVCARQNFIFVADACSSSCMCWTRFHLCGRCMFLFLLVACGRCMLLFLYVPDNISILWQMHVPYSYMCRTRFHFCGRCMFLFLLVPDKISLLWQMYVVCSLFLHVPDTISFLWQMHVPHLWLSGVHHIRQQGGQQRVRCCALHTQYVDKALQHRYDLDAHVTLPFSRHPLLWEHLCA
jgi:hypothetical protein